MSKPLTEEQLMEIYGLRLILLLETDPQSNQYRQVKLSPEQFKGVSDAFGQAALDQSPGVDEHNIEQVEIQLSEEEYSLPEHIQEMYGKD